MFHSPDKSVGQTDRINQVTYSLISWTVQGFGVEDISSLESGPTVGHPPDTRKIELKSNI